MQDTYLVTGSAGFIGSNLVRYLMYNHKCKMVSLDRLDTSASMHNVYSNKSHDFNIGDVCDTRFLSRVFELFRPNKVIHLTSSNSTSEETAGVENLIKCAKEFAVESLVYLSTSQVYDPEQCTFDEFSRIKPHTPLGVSKLAAEHLLRLSDVPYSVLRVPEIFGPRQINGFIPDVVRGLRNLEVCMVDDGNAVRDLLYVEDLCAAIDLVSQTPAHGALNVSINNDFKDKELAMMIIDQLLPPELHCAVDFHNFSKASDIPSGNMNSDTIRRLGWKPLRKFRERLKFTTGWYKTNTWVLSNDSA